MSKLEDKVLIYWKLHFKESKLLYLENFPISQAKIVFTINKFWLKFQNFEVNGKQQYTDREPPLQPLDLLLSHHCSSASTKSFQVKSLYLEPLTSNHNHFQSLKFDIFFVFKLP